MKTLRVRDDKDSGNYDLVLNLSGEFDEVTGLEMVEQNITTNIYAQKGEWFLDTEFGVDYKRIRGSGSISDVDLENLFAEAIANTDGVTHVYSLSVDRPISGSRHPRDYTVNYRIETIYGPYKGTL